MKLYRAAELCMDIYYADTVKTGFYSYYLASENAIVVSGTNHWTDWATNFTPTFSYQWQAEQILNLIWTEDFNRKTAVVGHSAGGAIAHKIASMLGCEAISFGAPRIFCGPFVGDRHILIEGKRDIITLPYRIINKSNTQVIRLPKVGHHILQYKNAIRQFSKRHTK